MKISPLAPKQPPSLPPLAGVRMASCEAGIKYAGRTDLLLMVFDEPAAVAGVFTRSKCSSAPVDWCRANLSTAQPTAKAVVVNAGNANAFTGARGAETVALNAQAAAQICGCGQEQVYLASTGVIGEPLEAAKISNALADLHETAEADHWEMAAQTIMTTDTYAKLSTQSLVLEGQQITIHGIAKGSGMIAPDMATMLSFVVSDMPVAQPLLQEILSELVEGTFNAVTVDSDTSTSDSLMLFSTAKAAVAPLSQRDDSRYQPFKAALQKVLHDLAMQVVRDGEGVSKAMEIHVTGAENDQAAKRIALSIANSPLVKTAVAGEDANWGRVVMAVGKAGERADRDLLDISFGSIRVAHKGARDPDYQEEAVSKVMQQDEILISVDVGITKGDKQGQARVWGCDLTKEYVAINGDYRS